MVIRDMEKIVIAGAIAGAMAAAVGYVMSAGL